MFLAKFATVIWKRSFLMRTQSFPPALIQFGELRSGTKSDLFQYLEKIIPGQADVPSVEALLLHSAAIVNMSKPDPSRTFLEHSQGVFLLYLEGQFKNVQMVDVHLMGQIERR